MIYKILIPLIIVIFLINIKKINSQNWIELNTPTTNNLKSCSFVNKNIGWIISTTEIFKTSDGGNSWSQQYAPTTTPFCNRTYNSVQFYDDNLGVIFCSNELLLGVDSSKISAILMTFDGGTSWLEKEIGYLQTSMFDCCFVSENIIYIIGDKAIKRTNNKGDTWDVFYKNSIAPMKILPLNNDTILYFFLSTGFEAVSVLCISFDNLINNNCKLDMWDYYLSIFNLNNTYWIGTNIGWIKKTTDFGLSWQKTHIGTNSYINDIAFIDNDKGWAITKNGKIFYTYNGGLDWTHEYSTPNSLNSMKFLLNEAGGYIVGDNGTILKFKTSNIELLNTYKYINIFPNPTTDNINITFLKENNKYNLKIFNITGALVQNEQLTNKDNTINISLLPKGIYIFKIESDSEQYIKKVIIN